MSLHSSLCPSFQAMSMHSEEQYLANAQLLHFINSSDFFRHQSQMSKPGSTTWAKGSHLKISSPAEYFMMSSFLFLNRRISGPLAELVEVLQRLLPYDKLLIQKVSKILSMLEAERLFLILTGFVIRSHMI